MWYSAPVFQDHLLIKKKVVFWSDRRRATRYRPAGWYSPPAAVRRSPIARAARDIALPGRTALRCCPWRNADIATAVEYDEGVVVFEGTARTRGGFLAESKRCFAESRDGKHLGSGFGGHWLFSLGVLRTTYELMMEFRVTDRNMLRK